MAIYGSHRLHYLFPSLECSASMQQAGAHPARCSTFLFTFLAEGNFPQYHCQRTWGQRWRRWQRWPLWFYPWSFSDERVQAWHFTSSSSCIITGSSLPGPFQRQGRNRQWCWCKWKLSTALGGWGQIWHWCIFGAGKKHFSFLDGKLASQWILLLKQWILLFWSNGYCLVLAIAT